MKTAKPTPMPIKGKPPAKPFIDPVKGNRPVGPKMPVKPLPDAGAQRTKPVAPKMPVKPLPDAGAARLKSGPKDPNAKNLRDMKASRAANKMFGMAKGGMTGKKGYAKGGMIKANCGASVKPAQKSGKK